jgi:hypothetical protein
MLRVIPDPENEGCFCTVMRDGETFSNSVTEGEALAEAETYNMGWLDSKLHTSKYPEDVVDIRWCIDDIKWCNEGRGGTVALSDGECRDILQRIKRGHDANIGINWDVIACHIDMYISENH